MKVIKCDICGKTINNDKRYQIRKRYMDMNYNWSWEYYDICSACIDTLVWIRNKEMMNK